MIPGEKSGFEEAQELFDSLFVEDLHIGHPLQWRATIRLPGQLYTVVYEERKDKGGEYYQLAALCKAAKIESINREENT